MVQKFIKIHSNDLVAVALCPLEKGTVCNVDGQEVTLIEDIAQGHKFALKDIKKDQPIIKYGYPIGIAKEDIKQGSWIHTHNMKTGLNDLLTYSYHRNVQELEPSEKRTFMGYRRKNGKVGVRNEIWIIPTRFFDPIIFLQLLLFLNNQSHYTSKLSHIHICVNSFLNTQ
jgi:altronate hydrolase